MFVLLLTTASDLDANLSENMISAADHLALFLLGMLLLAYSAAITLGVTLWKRSRRPRAPHEDLIALLQDEAKHPVQHSREMF